MDRDGKTVRLGWTWRAALAAALIALAPSCSDQPKVRCASARGAFAAKYTLVSGSGDCSLLKGDTLGLGSYNTSNSDGTPNWDDSSIAIQPYALAALTGGGPPPMAGDSNFSLGHITTSVPSSDNFCEVPTLSVAEVHIPAVTEPSIDGNGMVVCPSPAMDVKYEWSNVRLVVSAAVLGTEFAADLTYTNNGCTAQYRVWAVSPAVSCAGPTPPAPMEEAGTEDAADAESDVSLTADAGTNDATAGDANRSDATAGDANRSDATANDAGVTDAGASDAAAADAGGGSDGGLPPECTQPPAPTPAPVLDPTLCSPYADPSKNRPLGSGLNPDLFPNGITCDPATVLCVLTSDPGR
jgi:hypothetical protein